MTKRQEVKRFLVSCDVALYKALRKKLIDQDKSLRTWFEEQAKKELKK